jgi:hypothetical protein
MHTTASNEMQDPCSPRWRNKQGARIRARRLLVLAIFAATVSSYGQVDQPPPKTPSSPGISCAQEIHYPCNGISIGKPKVFDNRTLTLMLEDLSARLQGVQFIDQKSLAAAFGMLQGFQSSDFTSNVSISTLPTPGVTKDVTTTTGNVDSNGNPLPNTGKTDITTTRSSVTPQAPALDAAQTLSGFNPTFGQNPSDLLNDQVNLTYQIFNLRMILEKSLTDRLTINNKTRLQAVLGFNVTLDPPRTANDAVAVVEITLEANDSNPNGDGLSLISVMPMEKSYNSAAVSTKSNAFSGAAVVKMAQVGVSARKRSQVFYIYGDTDTLAYERMVPGQRNKVIFGWMFRPVLGRRSIAPGLRQLFALVALPAVDDKSDDSPHPLGVKVRTYWKKYDHKTMTSYMANNANRATAASFWLSLGLAEPQIFGKEYVNAADYPDVVVKPTHVYERHLRARVRTASWRPAGAKTALVTVDGENFFTGTSVAIGDKVLVTPTDGLVVKSNETLDVLTTIDALATGPGEIVSRYGAAVPIRAQDPKGRGFEIIGSKLSPPRSGYRTLTLELTGDMPIDPIITVNDKAVPLPYSQNEQSLSANLPESYLTEDAGIAKVTSPFLPPEKWTKTFPVGGTPFVVTRVSAKTITIARPDPLGFIGDPSKDLGIAVPPFCWRLLANDTAVTLHSSVCPNGTVGPVEGPNLASLTLENGIPDKVILVAPNTASTVLDVPKLQSDKSDTPKPIALKQYDSAWIDIPNVDLAKVAFVEANQIHLTPRPGKPSNDGKPTTGFQTEVTRAITAKPGDIDVTVVGKDGKTLGSVKLQISCAHCSSNGGQ